MTTAAAARVLAALSLVFASYVRAEDLATTAAPATAAATAGTPRSAGAPAREPRPRGAQDASRRPPPAVLVLPLLGLVLLPLTFPVTDPRVRHAARQGDARVPVAGANAAAATPAAAAPSVAADRAPAREPEACPACAGPRRPAADPG